MTVADPLGRPENARCTWRCVNCGSDNHTAGHGLCRYEFDPELSRRARWWNLPRLMHEYRPGSQPEPWSWSDEYEHLWGSAEHATRTRVLADDIAVNGQKEPVLAGGDGRIWDGHHRIVIAVRLGLHAVLVDWAGKETS